ncbi:MAG: type IV pilin N-terminal domain-containing protein [Desulfobacterales bacterium]|nr:type IV pilin N-terminal domain-containing protein [Desulfobacterales bacterium]
MSYKNGHLNSRKNRHSVVKRKTLTILDERAVSDVVGSIMMVAITVVMATIIAGAIFGMEPPADVPHVSYEIESNGTHQELLHMGGHQVKVSDLKFVSDGVEIFNTTDSQINGTGMWKIGTTITLDTNESDIMIIHLPSKELLK